MNCKLSFYILAVISMVIIAYNGILQLFSKNIENIDFMNKKIINVDILNESCCSMWSISHFVLFMVLGIFFPNCQILLIMLGILWEISEFIIGLRYKKTVNTNNVEYSTWWAGSFKDIVFNITGLYSGIFIGYLLRKYDIFKKL